jgi:hypothetical protein
MSVSVAQKVDEVISRFKNVVEPPKVPNSNVAYVDKMFDEIVRVKEYKWTLEQISDFVCGSDDELLALFGGNKLRFLFSRVKSLREQAKTVVLKKSSKPRKIKAVIDKPNDKPKNEIVAPVESNETQSSQSSSVPVAPPAKVKQPFKSEVN